MTPTAAQIAAFEKNSGTNPRSIMDTKTLDIKYFSCHLYFPPRTSNKFRRLGHIHIFSIFLPQNLPLFLLKRLKMGIYKIIFKICPEFLLFRGIFYTFLHICPFSLLYQVKSTSNRVFQSNFFVFAPMTMILHLMLSTCNQFVLRFFAHFHKECTVSSYTHTE